MTSKSMKVRIPGKLVILGEHAVVYGNRCLVSTVNKFLQVRVEKSESEEDIFFTPFTKDTSFVERAILFFRKKFKINEKVKISTESDLGNYGLGSSAAVTVGTIKALSLFFGPTLKDKELFDLCLAVVLSVQKKASGFDIASCIKGNSILFNGKTKDSLTVSKEKLPLVVGYSGKKARTVDLVNRVADLRKRKPRKTQKIFAEIEKIVLAGKKAVIEKDWESLGKEMSKNHKLLQVLGVSTEKLDRMVFSACKAGAYGAKLSGAGGGDCIIACVSREKRDQVIKAIIDSEGEALSILVG